MTETVRTHLRVRASELVGRNWLNTGGKSLDLESLRGKIVLLDFWTFCCINCSAICSRGFCLPPVPSPVIPPIRLPSNPSSIPILVSSIECAAGLPRQAARWRTTWCASAAG